jgi:hypothetical protein
MRSLQYVATFFVRNRPELQLLIRLLDETPVVGIDFDVRTKVALEVRWQLVVDLMREVHNGDDSTGRGCIGDWNPWTTVGQTGKLSMLRFFRARRRSENARDLLDRNLREGKKTACNSKKPGLMVCG